ncbi:MAG: trimeric intracellular cation channel family protein [Chitinophagaceae bacterium]
MFENSSEVIYSGFLNAIDVLGTIAFAISGAFAAIEKRLDPFGVIIIAFATAIGGGTLRDVLVGNLPVAWLRNDVTIYVILFTAVTVMLFGAYVKHLAKPLFLFDALGLGTFTIVGIEIALQYNFSAGICIALGTVTACFGGVIRDVLLNKVPLIFHKEIYALACIAGGTAYYFLYQSAVNNDLSKIICILLIVVIRFIAVRYGLSLPRIQFK